MRNNLKIAGFACLLLMLIIAGASPVWSAENSLPSWQGPVKQQLMEYIQAVTTSGHKDFIPPQERIAAFDLDGTVIAEKPMPFVLEISLVWLKKNCPGYGKKGRKQAALCRAADKGDAKEMRKLIEPLVALPYLGMELDAYRALALSVFETYINPIKNEPLKDLIYTPQLELITLLKAKGFKVWLCSGSSVSAMQAISAKYLGVPPDRCIGTRFEINVSEKDGHLSFKRGSLHSGLLNLRKVKTVNLKLATVTGPVLAFGNSMGDAWMLRYAADSPRRSLALVLDHDDPREFVYSKPELLSLAQERGWTVVSMKQTWKRVFPK